MFSSFFQTIPTSEIIASIKDRGYFFCENALTEDYVEQLLAEVDFDQILVNHNDVGVVISGTQRFLTHCLAKSKKAYDLITSPRVLDVCRSYFSERYQITNHRFCQTRGAFHMPWHTDNNLQCGRQLSGKHDMPGLLFLFYFSEQNVSPFQYVEDSQLWSKHYDHEIYLSDAWVNTYHGSKIRDFALPRGSFILCDIHGIHRAAPFRDRSHRRNILLFQVDQIGDRYIGHGEQNLINTEFIDNLSPEILDYLGFGIKRTYPAFPSSSVATMSVEDLLTLQKQLLPLTLQLFGKNLAKALLPGDIIVNLKRAIWALKSKKM